MHKTITEGARATFLSGPGSIALTNEAGIRENKLLVLYRNFTVGLKYLHEVPKHSRVEADEFHSQTAKMKSQLQIRFEMDLPVLRDFAVTNGLASSGTQTYFAFIEAKETNKARIAMQL